MIKKNRVISYEIRKVLEIFGEQFENFNIGNCMLGYIRSSLHKTRYMRRAKEEELFMNSKKIILDSHLDFSPIC